MPVAFWRMGPTPVPVADIGRMARGFEENGWDGLAVGEAHAILPDPYTALAVAATTTSRLQLGTAVAVPLRDPLLAASAMATVHAVSGGRGFFSIGRGDGAMKVIGREPISVKAFERYLTDLQRFLRGDEVDLDGRIASMARMPVVDDSFDLPKVPVDVAATGPKMIDVAARLADSVSFAVGADVERLQRCIATAKASRVSAGLELDAMAFGAYVQMAVTSNGDTGAREAVRGIIMTHARFSGFTGEALPDVPDGDRGLIRDSVTAMDTMLSTGHRTIGTAVRGRNEVDFYPHVVDDEFVDRFGIIGAPDYCAERLQQIVDLGLTHIFIGTRSVGADPTEQNTARIATEVLPLVRR